MAFAVAWLPEPARWRSRKSRWRSPRTSSGTGQVGARCQRRDTAPAVSWRWPGDRRPLRTVATALIASAAAALHETASNRSIEIPRVRELSQQLRAGIATVAPESVIMGEALSVWQASTRFAFPGCQADALLMLLDPLGSLVQRVACTAGVPRPSHVLLAMGVPSDQALGNAAVQPGLELATI